MKQHEDYVSGPHKYWLHFFGGFVLGLLLGYCFFRDLFESWVLEVIATAITGVAFGLFCGRWGEVGWRRISDWLSWWFGTLR
ncbi:MAG TPA: hypothetical protein VI136_06120 [Verrucomicrobiae bacterium]